MTFRARPIAPLSIRSVVSTLSSRLRPAVTAGILGMMVLTEACAAPTLPGYDGGAPATDADEVPSTGKKKKKTSSATDDTDTLPAPTTTTAPSTTGPTLPGSTPGTPGTPGSTAIELLTVSPVSAPAGGADVTIALTGNNFNATSSIKFGGGAIATQFQSATALQGTIPASKLQTPGTYPVVVTTAGVDSANIVFTVSASNNPVTVTSVNPPSATQGSGPLAITLTGTGFSGTPSVLFNGQALTNPAVTSPTSITATIPATLLATTGTFPITVNTGGAPSAPVTFRVDGRPVPTMSGISTTSATVGRGDLAVTVTGANFTGDAKVAIVSGVTGASGVVGVTTVQSTGQLTTTVTQNHFSVAGTVQLRVYIPQPNNGAIYSPSSTWKSITVTAAPTGTGGTAGTAGTTGTGGVPAIGSIVVDAYDVGVGCTTDLCVAGGYTVTVNGTGFGSQNTVFLGALSSNKTATITSVSPTRIDFQAPTDLAGQYRVYICNPNQSNCARSADLLEIQ